MPKDVSERIIDSPFALTTRSGSVSIGGGGGGGGGATNLDALTDVTLSAPSSGQTLSYNGSQWINAAPAAMTAHALSGSFHTGLLVWSKVDTAGSNLTDITTRLHSDLQGMTPNDHHFQAHVLATGTALGADHTISGAAAGEVLRAIDATHAAFDVLHHTDLDNVLPDQHHPFVHDIITSVPGFGVAHTVTGADYTVVGVHPANTLAILPTSPAPGAAISVLRTDANGGIQLDTNLFYVDGANNWIGVNRTPSGATLDLIASANADHTQRIKMKSGQTARLWRIEDLSGNELIVLDSVGNLQSGSPGFVSGLTGWQITPQGNAEFNNIWARGELHATVFVKDEVHATGGTLLVATAGTLHDDAVISSSAVDDDTLVVYSTAAGVGAGVPLQVVTTSGTFVGNELHVSWIGNFINVNDPPSGPGFYFQPGDIVRSKTEVATGVTDFWLEVNSAVQNSGYATYSVVKRSGTDGTLPKGAALVSYGKEGDGRIMLTSDLNYAPYIDVFTVGPNVWTGNAGAIVPRMRMGRLDGIGLPGVSGVTQYGMIAGKDLSDANSGYLIASNLQFSLYKVDIRLNNGVSDTGLWTADGNLKIGSNVGALATTGFQVITTGARSGDVVIGNEATGNFMRWQQSTGILTVTGNLVISDPGTTVTKTYVDAQDSAFDSLAQGYGSSAQTGSQAYSDARRIVGVTGSWDSPTATTIRWGTKAVTATPASVALSAAFGNNTNRVIADHAAASVSVTSRTYFFVNVSGTGTMTMTPTTSLATVMASPNNVLIAVADPGDATTKACSITIVAGSTYISGSNIFTGSIVAANIAAGTITANKLDASTLTVTYLDPVQSAAATDATTKANTAQTNATSAAATDATTKANTAQTTAISTAASDATTKANNAATAAQSYGDDRRVLGTSGTWTVIDGDTISWTGVSVKFANGSARAITDSPGNYSFGSIGRWYLFVDMSAGTLTMVGSGSPSTLFSAMTLNDVLIAVVDTYASPGKASINMVAGSTYISGGNIVTQSIRSTQIAASTIVASNIAASTITADRMNIDYLGGMSSGMVRTGILEMDTFSNIHTAGKTWANAVAGFFLGYDTTFPASAYKFRVGDITKSELSWDGSTMAITGTQSLQISNTSTGQIISMSGPSSSSALMTLTSANILTFGNQFIESEQFRGGKLVVSRATFQIEQARTIVHSQAMPQALGLAGEMCWDTNYLYICVAANNWRRIRLDPLDTW